MLLYDIMLPHPLLCLITDKYQPFCQVERRAALLQFVVLGLRAQELSRIDRLGDYRKGKHTQ
jgi:hypothetical protein